MLLPINLKNWIDINLPTIVEGQVQNIQIKEGEIFLLPPRIPHSPQRGPNTVGLVVERKRKPGEQDACLWFCENCNQKLHRASFFLDDIVMQLPVLMDDFYSQTGRSVCIQPHSMNVRCRTKGAQIRPLFRQGKR